MSPSIGQFRESTTIGSVQNGWRFRFRRLYEISDFVSFEEKTIRGTLIGSRKDMKEVIRIANEKNIEVVSKAFPLEQANEVLAMLKTSEIEARAVLIP